jgi:hypothetical protein
MSAINHGTEVPANSRREVLMGYQYALHQHKKKLREEKDEFRRSQENNSVSSGEYWDEYSEASESSRDRHRDPKHNRRTMARAREENQAMSISVRSSDDEEDFLQETPEAALVAAHAYLLIRLKRIYNFLCSLLVFTPFTLCFVTLRGVFMRFPELTY